MAKHKIENNVIKIYISILFLYKHLINILDESFCVFGY